VLRPHQLVRVIKMFGLHNEKMAPMTDTPAKEDKTKKPRRVRTYAEKIAAARTEELAKIERLKKTEQNALDAYNAARSKRVAAEQAIGAPTDPDMLAAVAESVPEVHQADDHS
jgi:hypothetical protein